MWRSVSFFCFILFRIFVYKVFYLFFFFKQKTAYEMRISDWSSDVCSSDLYSSGHGETTGPSCGVGLAGQAQQSGKPPPRKLAVPGCDLYHIGACSRQPGPESLR